MNDNFDPQSDAVHDPATNEDAEYHAVTRRTFLRGTTAVILASSITVLAADCGGPNESAPPIPPPPAIEDEYLYVPTTPNAPLPTKQLVFFSAHEAATIEALTARIIPGTPDDPGAREAGVVHYIDNLLSFNHGDDRATYRSGPLVTAYEGDNPPPGLDLTKVVPVKKSELPRYSYQSTQTPDVEYQKESLRKTWDSVASVQIQGESLPYEDQFYDLDPVYKDAWGQPILRFTFDWHQNDYNLYRYMATKSKAIVQAMNPTDMHHSAELKPFEIQSYQSTHMTGGAIMGADPGTSVTNKYGQVWDTPNVFVTGAALYPQNPCFNPTGTLAPLAYMTGDTIRDKYFKQPNKLLT